MKNALRFSNVRFITIVLGVFIYSNSFSQNIVKGRVLDAKTNEPMPFANVHIANSTKGTQTDEIGTFSMQNVPMGTVQLLVSYVGYESYSQTLKIEPNTVLDLKISIKPNDQIFSEIEVKSKRDKSWERKIKEFRLAFLGQNYDGKKCKILNEWVMDFKDIEGGFSGTALAPLEIENRILGYKIVFDLKEFTRTNHNSFYLGFPLFEELTPVDNKEYRKWLLNRREAFLRSPERFLRSLYRGTIEEEGYFVYKMNTGLEWFSRETKFMTPLNQITNQNVSKTILLEDSKYKILKLDTPIQVINANISTLADGRMRTLKGYTDILEDGWMNNPRAIEMGGMWAAQGVSEMLPREYASTPQPAISDLLAKDNNSNFGIKSKGFNRVYLHTNKPGFVTGENIWFSAYIFNSDNRLSRKVMPLYVQLHNKTGEWVTEQIIYSSNGRGVGYLHLADSLESGIYRLRAYTREMLNVPVTIFDKEIVVQNPKSEFQVLKKLKTWEEPKETKLDLNILPDKKQFSVNEKVNIKLLLKNSFNEPVSATLSTSVINSKFQITDNEDFNIASYMHKSIINPQIIGDKYTYEPNISISGTVFSTKTQKAISNAKLLFMFTGSENTTTKIAEADKEGKFRITDLDFIGKNVLVYQVNSNKNTPDENGVIVFDRFPIPLQIAPTTFENGVLTSEMKNILVWQQQNPDGMKREIDIAKTEIAEDKGPQKEEIDPNKVGVPNIYGEPDYYVNFDKAMNFPNVYEMLQGNLPGVKVDRINNAYKVFVRGIGSWNTDRLDPLFLVDGIEMTQLAAVNPNDVIRIELLSGGKAAIFGMKGANGVIAFYTRRFGEKKAGLQFAKSETVNGYQKEIDFKATYNVPINDLNDFRSTIYWNPEIILNNQGEGEISFLTGKNPNTYKVIVEGVTLFGLIVRKEINIEVK
jgi:CarboxypepD_reg-like domain/TonB-dependent Receptor Plug Domain